MNASDFKCMRSVRSLLLDDYTSMLTNRGLGSKIWISLWLAFFVVRHVFFPLWILIRAPSATLKLQQHSFAVLRRFVAHGFVAILFTLHVLISRRMLLDYQQICRNYSASVMAVLWVMNNILCVCIHGFKPVVGTHIPSRKLGNVF